MSLALQVYRLATRLLEPLAPALLARRIKAGKENALRWRERLGYFPTEPGIGVHIWLHGASVGESLSLLPLITALKALRPDIRILVTSGTVASAEVLADRLPAGVSHQFSPLDFPKVLDRVFRRWRPWLVVLVESEIWPNLILEAKAWKKPIVLLSARLSDKSLKGWRRAPAAAKTLFRAFAMIQAQDDESAQAIKSLGGRDDGRLNLKLAAEPLPVAERKLAALRKAAGGRPILLAASTHPHEDEIVLAAFAPLAARPERPILVIAPRHPKRGPAIAELAEQAGFSVSRQKAGQGLELGASIYVADSLGELGLWFSLAEAALVGGSLVPLIGGHNPLEPALLGCPIISGRHVFNWQSVYRILDQDRVVHWVDGAADLEAQFAAALPRSPALAEEAVRAKALVERLGGGLSSTVSRLLELMDR